MTEARFGFMQALSAWKDNEAARAGLEVCLEIMIEHEIAQRDAGGARSLYSELAEPRPDTLRRIEGLEADLREAAQREERLRAMERDIDLRVGGRAQLAVIGVMVTLAVTLSMILLQRDERLPTPGELVKAPALALSLLVLVAFIGRRHLRTAISRRAIAALVLMPASVLVHRVLSTLQGAPMAPILTSDLIIATAVTGTLGITLVPRIGWVAVPFGAGAIAVTLRPDIATSIFPVCVTSAMVLLFVVWVRSIRA
jgi:hypothetical protein